MEFLGVAFPSRIERKHVLLRHALKQSNHMVAILQYQPSLRLISHENGKTQLFVTELRRSISLTAKLTEKLPSSIGADKVPRLSFAPLSGYDDTFIASLVLRHRCGVMTPNQRSRSPGPPLLRRI